MGTRRRIIKTELDREGRVIWRVAKALAADGDICCGIIEAPRVDAFKSRNMPSGTNRFIKTGPRGYCTIGIHSVMYIFPRKPIGRKKESLENLS